MAFLQSWIKAIAFLYNFILLSLLSKLRHFLSTYEWSYSKKVQGRNEVYYFQTDPKIVANLDPWSHENFLIPGFQAGQSGLD